MIDKKDIKVGTLVAYYNPTKSSTMKIFEVSKINDKSFNVNRGRGGNDVSNVRFDDSKYYTVLTQEQFDKMFNNAFEERCKSEMNNVHKVVSALTSIKKCLCMVIDVDDSYGVKSTIDITSVLNKLDDVLNKLIEVSGKPFDPYTC